MRKKTLINILMVMLFFIANLQTPDIVFADASMSLWACCYQHLGARLDCSSMYSEPIASSFPCSLSRHHCEFQDRSSSRDIDYSVYPLLMIFQFQVPHLRSIADLSLPCRPRQRDLLCSFTGVLNKTSGIKHYHIIFRNFVHQ